MLVGGSLAQEMGEGVGTKRGIVTPTFIVQDFPAASMILWRDWIFCSNFSLRLLCCRTCFGKSTSTSVRELDSTWIFLGVNLWLLSWETLLPFEFFVHSFPFANSNRPHCSHQAFEFELLWLDVSFQTGPTTRGRAFLWWAFGTSGCFNYWLTKGEGRHLYLPLYPSHPS